MLRRIIQFTVSVKISNVKIRYNVWDMIWCSQEFRICFYIRKLDFFNLTATMRRLVGSWYCRRVQAITHLLHAHERKPCSCTDIVFMSNSYGGSEVKWYFEDCRSCWERNGLWNCCGGSVMCCYIEPCKLQGWDCGLEVIWFWSEHNGTFPPKLRNFYTELFFFCWTCGA